MKPNPGYLLVSAVLTFAVTLPTASVSAAGCEDLRLTENAASYSAPPSADKFLGMYRGEIGQDNRDLPLFCGNVDIVTIDENGHITGSYVVVLYKDRRNEGEIRRFTFEGIINKEGEAYVVTSPKRLSFKFKITNNEMNYLFFGKDQDTPGLLIRDQ